MPAKNKSRGKYFEDKIANEIRQALNLTKKEVHRNISSGVALFESGDIWTPWPCIIECKYYKTFEVRHIIEEKDYIVRWLDEQVNKERLRFIQVYNKDPLCMLVIGRPYHPSYAVCKKDNIRNNDFLQVEENILPKIETKNLISHPLDVLMNYIKENIESWQN